MAVTTWNTAPDYDTWGSDLYWNCDDWITWHKFLKEHFGSERANLIWNYAYAQGTQFAKHYDCRTLNSNFRSYASQNDLDTYASINIPIIPQILDLAGSGFDIVSGVSDTITDIFGDKKTFKILGYALVLAGVGYLGLRGYVYYKSKLGK
jgi:hypothetical protein